MDTNFTGRAENVKHYYFAHGDPIQLLNGISEFFDVLGRREQFRKNLDSIHIEYDQHSGRHVATVSLLEMEI